MKLDLWSLIVGALLTAFGVFLNYHSHARREKAKRKEILNAALQAIHDELQIVWEQYQQGTGNRLEKLKDGQPLSTFTLGSQNYFTVYEQNASLIGQIQDAAIRKSIVTTYTGAKMLLDCYAKHNILTRNTYALRYEFLEKMHTSNFGDKFKGEKAVKKLEAAVEDLVQHTEILKPLHYDLKEKINETLRLLKNTPGVVTTR